MLRQRGRCPDGLAFTTPERLTLSPAAWQRPLPKDGETCSPPGKPLTQFPCPLSSCFPLSQQRRRIKGGRKQLSPAPTARLGVPSNFAIHTSLLEQQRGQVYSGAGCKVPSSHHAQALVLRHKLPSPTRPPQEVMELELAWEGSLWDCKARRRQG